MADNALINTLLLANSDQLIQAELSLEALIEDIEASKAVDAQKNLTTSLALKAP